MCKPNPVVTAFLRAWAPRTASSLLEATPQSRAGCAPSKRVFLAALALTEHSLRALVPKAVFSSRPSRIIGLPNYPEISAGRKRLDSWHVVSRFVLARKHQLLMRESQLPTSVLPESLAVHFSGMGVIQPSGGANAGAGYWPTSEEHIPSGLDRVRVGLFTTATRLMRRSSDHSLTLSWYRTGIIVALHIPLWLAEKPARWDRRSATDQRSPDT